MPFGLVSVVGRGMTVVDGVEIVEGEGAALGVNVRHPIVINGDFVAYYLPSGVATRLFRKYSGLSCLKLTVTERHQWF